jgi:hypothetical protein
LTCDRMVSTSTMDTRSCRTFMKSFIESTSV